MSNKLTKLVEYDDYDPISRYLDIRNIESFENLGVKFLEIDLNADECQIHSGACYFEKLEGNFI